MLDNYTEIIYSVSSKVVLHILCKNEKKEGDIMPNRKEIGQYITRYLEDNKMNVETFAALLGASKSSVYNWIAGKPMLSIYYNILLELFRPYFEE